MKISTANIRSVLEISGPMTRREVAQFFPDVHHRVVASFISAMRSTIAKQIYIQSWTMEGIGRRYPRAVYALGDKRDASKPKPISQAERHREYRRRMKPPKVANSVFTWAGQL
jgi:hypothetical protein